MSAGRVRRSVRVQRVAASRRCRSGVVALGALACAAFGVAGSDDAHAHEAGTLRVGIATQAAPPYHRRIDPIAQEPSGLAGFDVSLAEAFANDQGLRIAWVDVEAGEAAAALESGRVDLVVSGLYADVSLAAQGRVSLAVAVVPVVLVARPQSDAARALAVDDAADRAGVRVAVPGGGALEARARSELTGVVLEPLSTSAAVREALRSGAIDAAVSDAVEAAEWQRTLDITNVRELGTLRRVWLTEPGAARLGAALDAWLVRRELDGTLLALRKVELARRSLGTPGEPLEATLAAASDWLALADAPLDAEDVTASRARILGAAREASERLGAAPPAEEQVAAVHAALLRRAAVPQALPIEVDRAAARARVEEQLGSLLAQLAAQPPHERADQLVRRGVEALPLASGARDALTQALARLAGSAPPPILDLDPSRGEMAVAASAAPTGPSTSSAAGRQPAGAVHEESEQ